MNTKANPIITHRYTLTMKNLQLLIVLSVLFQLHSRAQAVFQSNGNGNWNDPSIWTLISGSSSSNYPVAGDSASIVTVDTITVITNSQCQALTIEGAGVLHLNSNSSILTVSNQLTVTGASEIIIDLGALTITGQATINGASVVTLNQGLMTVLGLMILSFPTGGAGTTLLDIEGGAFTCAGGMSIVSTTVPANRFSELRIGNSAVSIAGGLASVTANAKINFTGAGVLTLAGVISIASAGFTPGNGTVIYFGIPGTDQTLEALTYNNLTISGIGGGIKEINGAVTVTDTLTLLTDTLVVNSGGSLTMGNGSAIVRTAGQLASTPVFPGQVDIVYNNVTRDTTGPEMPVAEGVLRNLTINDIAGIKLGANVTVNNNVNFQNGPLLTDVYAFNIANTNGGAGADPAVQRTNGYVIGSINRSIGMLTGTRLFPLGVNSQNYRELTLNYTTAPTAGGTLAVQHFDTSAAAQSGLPLTEGAVVISNTAPMYWQADAASGLTGGVYSLSLTAQGVTGVNDISSLRIVKRSSGGGAWILDGTAGTNTGANDAPVVLRDGMSDFSQFAFGGGSTNVLPVSLLYFSGQVSGKNVLLSWTTTGETNNSFYSVEYSKSGIDFTALGRIEAALNQSQQNEYSFTHSNVPAGTGYYRLMQTDVDGKFSYSNIISFRINNENTVKVYPVLATTSITIAPGTATTLRLFDASGRYIRNVYAGTNDISSLATGMYYIVYKGGVAKFIRQ